MSRNFFPFFDRIEFITHPSTKISQISEAQESLISVCKPRCVRTYAVFLAIGDHIKDSLYRHPTPGAYSYILEIEDKIIIPALSNYPEYFEKVPVDEIRSELAENLRLVKRKALGARRILVGTRLPDALATGHLRRPAGG